MTLHCTGLRLSSMFLCQAMMLSLCFCPVTQCRYRGFLHTAKKLMSNFFFLCTFVYVSGCRHISLAPELMLNWG